MHDRSAIVRSGRTVTGDRARQYARPVVVPYVRRTHSTHTYLGNGARKRRALPVD